MMREPTREIPDPTEWPGTAVRSADRGEEEPVDFVLDPEFDESADLVTAADRLLADAEVLSFFTGELDDIRLEVEDICAERWPDDGAWIPTRPDVRTGSEAGDAYAEFFRPTQLSQKLDTASVDEDDLAIWFDIEFIDQQDGFLIAALSGPGIEACEAWYASDRGGRRAYESIAASRDPTIVDAFGNDSGDEIYLYGAGVRVYRVTAVDPVVPVCVGDTNGDNAVNFADLEILLDAWGSIVTPGEEGDINGDGRVDFADLEILLEEWGTTCDGA